MIESVSAPAFEGIDNFRDFGGYAVSGGQRVASKRLYRSAHHGRATDGDLGALHRLDLGVVVDLRRLDERRREPSRRPPEFRALIVENDADPIGGDTYVEFLKTSDLSVKAMGDFLLDYYSHAPSEPRHIDLYARYFRAMAETDGAVLIHCAAGKDRTGILAALTHQVLGVHLDDTIEDFLLTNDPNRIEQRLPLFSDFVVELTGRRPPDEAVRTTLGVETSYLEAAFKAMRTGYGSVDAYLETALGVDRAMKKRLVEKLVA